MRNLSKSGLFSPKIRALSSNFQESAGETSPSPHSSNPLEVMKSKKFLCLLNLE